MSRPRVIAIDKRPRGWGAPTALDQSSAFFGAAAVFLVWFACYKASGGASGRPLGYALSVGLPAAAFCAWAAVTSVLSALVVRGLLPSLVAVVLGRSVYVVRLIGVFRVWLLKRGPGEYVGSLVESRGTTEGCLRSPDGRKMTFAYVEVTARDQSRTDRRAADERRLAADASRLTQLASYST